MRLGGLRRMRNVMANKAALFIGVVVLLSGCNRAPEPTLSASDAATRLAQIPTAASLNATRVVASPTPANGPSPAPTAVLMEQPQLPTSLPIVGEFAQYEVKPGDSLSTIAFNANVSMASIQLANNLGESQIVKIGQTLKIPQSKAFPDENVLWVIVVVKPGETLGGICQRNGVRLDDAVRVNKLRDASDIRGGQELIMPVNSPASLAASEPVAQVVTDGAPTPLPPEPTSNKAASANSSEIISIIPIVPITPIETPRVIPEVAPELVVAHKLPEQERASAQNSFAASGETSDVEVMRAQVLALYNQARADAGLAPLAASSTLQQAAQLHAQDCAQRGFGSHTGSDGANTQTRVARVGFVGRTWGENWAWARSPDRAFEMWFTEEPPDGPHRKNILSSRYAEVGFGIVPSNGGFYFIADFGAP